MEILKYKGTDKYIVGLAKNENKNYIFFAYIDSIALNQETEDFEIYGRGIKYITSEKYIIELLLKLGANNSFIHFLEIKDEKEYETVCKFLEFIL